MTCVPYFKESIRARDGYRCTACGMTQAQHRAKHKRRLEVHRKKPGRLGGQYVEANCVTLCKRCHAAADKALRPRMRSVRLRSDTIRMLRLVATLEGKKPAVLFAELVQDALVAKYDEALQLLQDAGDRMRQVMEARQ